jgi:hypothetical protein
VVDFKKLREVKAQLKPIAFALEIFHDEVAGSVPVGRGADHHDRPHPFEERAGLPSE